MMTLFYVLVAKIRCLVETAQHRGCGQEEGRVRRGLQTLLALRSQRTHAGARQPPRPPRVAALDELGDQSIFCVGDGGA